MPPSSVPSRSIVDDAPLPDGRGSVSNFPSHDRQGVVRRLPLVFFLILLASSCQSSAQSVTPRELTFRMVEGGPVSLGQPIVIRDAANNPINPAADKFSATEPWVAVVPASTPAAPTLVGLIVWRAQGQPVGNYSATLNITVPGSSTPLSVRVTWQVIPRAPGPKFSYLNGAAKDCQPFAGFPEADPAMCTVAGERPPGNFTPPPVGGSYIDSNFGSRVRIVSEAPFYHMYSTPSAISAGNRYVYGQDRAGFFNILDLSKGTVAFSRVEGGGSAWWDASNDNVYYWLEGLRLRKHDLSTRRTTTVADYSAAPFRFTTRIENGGTGDSTRDNWKGFFAQDQKQVCAIDLNRVQTYCAGYDNLAAVGGIPFETPDYTLVTGIDSGSRKRYVLLMADPAIAVFSVNTATGRLDFEFRGPEDPENKNGRGNDNGTCDPGEICLAAYHADVMEGSSGVQHLVILEDTESPGERAIVYFQLNKGINMRRQVELGGGRRRVMAVHKQNQGGYTDYHVGCAKAAPVCAISITHRSGPSAYNPASGNPIVRIPHLSEIILVRDAGAEARRLMQHRSVSFTTEGDEGYWSFPRSCLSNDGTLMLTTSNFGIPRGWRLAVADTGFGKARIGQSGVVNAASLAPKIAPGSYVTILGSSLAGCIAEANAAPLPDSLCGVSVSFNGRRGYLAYASPSQLNVVAPQAIPAGAELRVQVDREDGTSDSTVLPAAATGETAAALFTYSLDGTVLRAVAQNADYSLNGPLSQEANSRPLRPGEVGILYANALGSTLPAVPDGEPAPSSTLAPTSRPVEVYVNEVRQNVLFAGLVPNLVALYQVNFALDPSTPVLDETSNQVWIRVGEDESPRLVLSLAR